MLRVDADQAMTQALSVGVIFFQYRNKSETRKKIYETSLLLAQAARKAGAVFIVNDHVDIASAVDAGGVHLGQDDLPIECARKLLGKQKLIGVSTHSLEQARAAEAAGADYIGFGPVFETSTKDAGAVCGIEKLSIIKKSVSIPVIAIGGISHSNIRQVLGAGADGAAMISAVLSTDDIASAARKMMGLISEMWRKA
jgi:thiamine-phosphate pyrophosphorylase